MRVSLHTIKQFIDFDLPPVDELVARINQQLGTVEQVIELGDKYKDAVIVKVVAAEKHPNADRLSVTKIDDGGTVADVERDDDGLVQVVCGAPNVRAGMYAIWLPPKSTVPASYDDDEPFVLSARELRGVVSQGMLAAADELAIGTDHEGIIEVTEKDIMPQNDTLGGLTSQQLAELIGRSFAETFGLDDTIIDIENKMFTHRPDCFGQLGVAREIAGILGQPFHSPDWYSKLEDSMWKAEDGKELSLKVFNEAGEKVPRFMAVALHGVKVQPSPLWLQCALVAMGSKPINNIVDVTNYVMLLTAQPTHAYDYNKLRGHTLGTRTARPGEQAALLNGKTYELDETDIVIVDGEGVVGLGGIMGGLESEVTSETTSIVLEVATFDMYTLRKSSMRHGLFTDALTRFNKGQSPLQNDHVMSVLLMSIKDVAPASALASEVADVVNIDLAQCNSPVTVSDEFISERLGVELDDVMISTLLNNVELRFEINHDNEDLIVKPPFWRTDIELPEDVVEEVGRLYGFDKLPRELPRRSIRPADVNRQLALKSSIRDVLSRAGANEVLGYSFVHGDLLMRTGQDRDHAYQLGNALSPDLQYFRLSLMPSLLSKVHPNIKAGYDQFALFELGKAHIVGETDDDGLPREDELTGLVVAAADKTEHDGAAYYQAKRYLEQLVPAEVSYRPVPEAMQGFDITKPYDMKRSAVAYVGETFIGIIGEFRLDVRRALKLPDYCAGFELDTYALMDLVGQTTYRPLSRYPSTERDICFQVSSDVSYSQIVDTVQSELTKTELDTSVTPVDIYQPADGTTKNVTIRITLASHDKTLTGDEASSVLESVIARVTSTLKASVI